MPYRAAVHEFSFLIANLLDADALRQTEKFAEVTDDVIYTQPSWKMAYCGRRLVSRMDLRQLPKVAGLGCPLIRSTAVWVCR